MHIALTKVHMFLLLFFYLLRALAVFFFGAKPLLCRSVTDVIIDEVTRYDCMMCADKSFHRQ